MLPGFLHLAKSKQQSVELVLVPQVVLNLNKHLVCYSCQSLVRRKSQHQFVICLSTVFQHKQGLAILYQHQEVLRQEILYLFFQQFEPLLYYFFQCNNRCLGNLLVLRLIHAETQDILEELQVFLILRN